MFGSAKRVARPAAPEKVKAGTSRPVDVIPGWADVCAIDACVKALLALKELKAGPIKEAAMQRLIARGMERRSKPDTMTMAEGDAAGTITIRRRASNQPVTAEEAELIADLVGAATEDDGLHYTPGFTEILEADAAYLTINPDYMPGGALYDELKLKRIERLIEKEAPDLIIQVEPSRKVIVSETAVDRLFQIGPAVNEKERLAKVTQLFPLLASIVPKPVHKNLRAAWAYVETLLGEVPAETEKPKRAAA